MSAETEVNESNVTPTAQESVPAAPTGDTNVENSATQQGTPATTPEQDEQRKARGGFQRRIDELVREREYERAEKQRLHDLLARQTNHQPQQQPAGPQKAEAPKIESFSKYEDYLQALTDFRAEQIYEAREKARQERETQAQSEAKQRETVEQQQRAIAEQQRTLNKLTAEAEKKYPDFYEKVFEQAPDVVPISPVVGQAILKSKEGMDIAYYLGTHPEEAQRIAKLDAVDQLVEVGVIRSSLAKQQSSAPAPINHVGGRQSVSNDLANTKTDMKTWVKQYEAKYGKR